MLALEKYTEKMMDPSKKDIKMVDIIKEELEKEDWVSNVEKVEGEDDQIKIITKDKNIIVIKVNDDGTIEVIERGKDDGDPYPSLTLTQEPYNEDSGEKIKIKVDAEVEKTTKTKKVTTVRIVKPENMKQEKEYTEGGVIFEVDANGVYTIEVETNMGKTRRKTIGINIVKPESDIEITSEPVTARNTESTGTQNGIAKGPINVEIKYGDNSYIKQYKKETDESWTTVTGNTVNFTVAKNMAIFAKYSDGTNSFKTVTYNIQNVDNVAPTISSYDVTINGDTIIATCTAIDTASEGASNTTAGILKYEYSNGGSNYQESNTFKVSKEGTYTIYVKVVDRAGNETVQSKQVTVNGYTVTYNANGGTGAPANQTAISGTNITLSTEEPTRTGYTFLGWATDSNATTVSYAKGANYTENKSITLYAVWETKVTFYGEGFTGAYSNDKGSITTQPTGNLTLYIDFKADNYTLTIMSWTGTKIATWIPKGKNEETINLSSTPQTININEAGTLKLSGGCNIKVELEDGTSAEIKYIGYTIKYDTNGGKIYNADATWKADQMIKPGSNISITNPGIYNYGSELLGFSENKDDKNPTYKIGDTLTPTSSKTLYCVWKDTEVAKIGTKTYNTLQKAIDEAKNGETITVLENISQSPGTPWANETNYKVESEKNITIDLNGFSIKSPNCVFTINDTSSLNVTGTGTLSIYGGYVIQNNSTGTVTINEGVTCVSETGQTIKNTSTGKIIINGAKVTNSNNTTCCISNSSNGKIEIKEKSIVSGKTYAIINEGTTVLGVNDGNVNSNTPKIESTNGAAINNSGILEFYDGTISSFGSAAISNTGTIKTPTGYSVKYSGNNNNTANLTKD